MNTRSISFRLVAWYAGLLAVIFLLLCALLYLDLRHFLENDLRQSQSRRARQIANTLLAHVKQTGESYVASQSKDWYEPEINDRFIRITRADGTLVYVSDAPKDGSFDPAEVPNFPPVSKMEFSRKLKLSGGNTLLIAALNFKSSGNPAYLVEFGQLLDPVETMLNHLFLQLALGLPLAVFIIAGGGYLSVSYTHLLIWQVARNKSAFSAEFGGSIFVFGLGMVLPFGLTCLGLALAGFFPEFWFWTFTYARSYVTSITWSEGIHYLHDFLRDQFDLSLGFWMITAVGLPLAFFDRGSRNRAVFATVFCLCSFLGTATGLYFRPHYFILMLPGFALIQGMAVIAMQQVLRFRALENVLKSLPVILFITVLAWVVFYHSLIFFRLSPIEACQNLYPWNPFVESLAVARYIREHSTEKARIAVIGSEPQIYFYAQRRSATGYIYTYALMERQPNALKMQHEMMREIEAARPEYLVFVIYGFSWLFQPGSDHTILHWFDGYSGRFYKQVGIVQLNSAGKVEGIWGDAANSSPKPAGQYIAVYKRKSDLEINRGESDQPEKTDTTVP